jgi:hypothetical protein
MNKEVLLKKLQNENPYCTDFLYEIHEIKGGYLFTAFVIEGRLANYYVGYDKSLEKAFERVIEEKFEDVTGDGSLDVLRIALDYLLESESLLKKKGIAFIEVSAPDHKRNAAYRWLVKKGYKRGYYCYFRNLEN